MKRLFHRIVESLHGPDRVVRDEELLYVWARAETYVQAWWRGEKVAPSSRLESGGRSLWVFRSRPETRVILLNGSARRVRVTKGGLVQLSI